MSFKHGSHEKVPRHSILGRHNLVTSDRRPRRSRQFKWTGSLIFTRRRELSTEFLESSSLLSYSHTVPFRPTRLVIVIRGPPAGFSVRCHRLSGGPPLGPTLSSQTRGILYLKPLNMLSYEVPSHRVQEVANRESNDPGMFVRPPESSRCFPSR